VIRKAAGAVAGIVSAVLTVMATQWLSHSLYPPPAGLDRSDSEAVATHIANAPVLALLLVVAGYIIASFDGTLVAAIVGRAKPVAYALLIGLLMLVATTSNIIMIPHPHWFSASAIIGIIAAAWLASIFAARILGSDAA
tara:strand:+ start:1302 stop:1718 length:417 start_codon:yes stop_codon:yes gene_type:complete